MAILRDGLRLDVCARYDALLFDCDGTLVDTMALHYAAWREVLEPRGLAFPHARYMAMAGMPTREILLVLGEEQGVALDFDALLPEKETRFLSRLHEARPIEPVVAVVRAFIGLKPMGVVSGGVRGAVERTLDSAGIRAAFSVVVTAEDTARGKPDPAPFLLAASGLGVEAARCLVFEDGDPGLSAAARAGMDAVDVRVADR